MGLMQIMTKTWTELRIRYGLGNDTLMMLVTTFSLEQRISASCTIATVRRDSSPHTTRVLDDMTVIWQPGDRFRRRRESTSQSSRR